MSINSSLAIRNENAGKQILLSALQIFGASLFIALCAQIQIPLYFTPIPLTGQTFAIMLIAATMGSRKGALSVMAYIAEAAFGLPVLTGGGFGLTLLVGASGGYLVGFMLQAYLIGWCVEKQRVFSSSKTLLILLSSCAMQLGLGALWLSHYVGLDNALLFGVMPFVAGEVLKALAVTASLKASK